MKSALIASWEITIGGRCLACDGYTIIPGVGRCVECSESGRLLWLVCQLATGGTMAWRIRPAEVDRLVLGDWPGWLSGESC